MQLVPMLCVICSICGSVLMEFKKSSGKVESVCGKKRDRCSFRYTFDGKTTTTAQLKRQFSRSFGDEECDFYSNKKSDPVAYISICSEKGRKNEIEGVIYGTDFKLTISPTSDSNVYAMMRKSPQPSDRSLDEKQALVCRASKRNSTFRRFAPADRAVGQKSEEPVIELALAADDYGLRRRKSKAELEKFVYQVANGVCSFFHQVGIEIKIVDYRLISKKASDAAIRRARKETKNIRNKDKRGEELMDQYASELAEYLANSAYDPDADGDPLNANPDASLIISGLTRMGNDMLGIAFTGDLCKDLPSATIFSFAHKDEDEERKHLLHRVAATAAHELAHVLGLEHMDDCKDCNERRKYDKCLMAAVSEGFETDFWSTCSKKVVADILKRPRRHEKSCIYTWNIEVNEKSGRHTALSSKSASLVVTACTSLVLLQLVFHMWH